MNFVVELNSFVDLTRLCSFACIAIGCANRVPLSCNDSFDLIRLFLRANILFFHMVCRSFVVDIFLANATCVNFLNFSGLFMHARFESKLRWCDWMCLPNGMNAESMRCSSSNERKFCLCTFFRNARLLDMSSNDDTRYFCENTSVVSNAFAGDVM